MGAGLLTGPGAAGRAEVAALRQAQSAEVGQPVPSSGGEGSTEIRPLPTHQRRTPRAAGNSAPANLQPTPRRRPPPTRPQPRLPPPTPHLRHRVTPTPTPPRGKRPQLHSNLRIQGRSTLGVAETTCWGVGGGQGIRVTTH